MTDAQKLEVVREAMERDVERWMHACENGDCYLRDLFWRANKGYPVLSPPQR